MPVLADNLCIPYNNLTKLVQILNKTGFINTQRGKNGGVKIAKDAQEISVKDIIDIIDGPTQLTDCLTPKLENCKLAYTCKLKHVFSDIQQKINTMFDDVKIAQLT